MSDPNNPKKCIGFTPNLDRNQREIKSRYTFQLKATNENGEWSGYVRELTVVVLPPFWATWWAYLLYVIMVLVVGILIYRTTKNRMLLRNALRLREIEKAKVVGIQIVVGNFFQSIGKAKLSIFLSLTRQLLFLAPCLLILPRFFELKGIWISLPVSDSLSFVTSMGVLYMFLREMRRVHHSREA